jgi:hypothetical protein
MGSMNNLLQFLAQWKYECERRGKKIPTVKIPHEVWPQFKIAAAIDLKDNCTKWQIGFANEDWIELYGVRFEPDGINIKKRLIVKRAA